MLSGEGKPRPHPPPFSLKKSTQDSTNYHAENGRISSSQKESCHQNGQWPAISAAVSHELVSWSGGEVPKLLNCPSLEPKVR